MKHHKDGERLVSIDKLEHLDKETVKALSKINIYVKFSKEDIKDKSLSMHRESIIDILINDSNNIFYQKYKSTGKELNLDDYGYVAYETSEDPLHKFIYNHLQKRIKNKKHFNNYIGLLKAFQYFNPIPNIHSPETYIQTKKVEMSSDDIYLLPPEGSIEFLTPKVNSLSSQEITSLANNNDPFSLREINRLCNQETYSNLLFNKNFHACIDLKGSEGYYDKNIGFFYQKNAIKMNREHPINLEIILKFTQPCPKNSHKCRLIRINYLDRILSKATSNRIFFLTQERNTVHDTEPQNNLFTGKATIFQNNILVLTSSHHNFINKSNLFISKDNYIFVKKMINEKNIKNTYSGDEIYFSKYHKILLKIANHSSNFLSENNISLTQKSIKKYLQSISNEFSNLTCKKHKLSLRNIKTSYTLLKATNQSSKQNNDESLEAIIGFSANLLLISQLIQKYFEEPVQFLIKNSNFKENDIYNQSLNNSIQILQILKHHDIELPSIEILKEEINLLTRKNKRNDSRPENSDYVRLLFLLLPFPLP